jgi:hypothetical protein
MKVADLGGQAGGCVRRRSPRSEATGFKMTWTNVCLRVCSSDRSSDSNGDADGGLLDRLVHWKSLKFQRFRQSALGSSMV